MVGTAFDPQLGLAPSPVFGPAFKPVFDSVRATATERLAGPPSTSVLADLRTSLQLVAWWCAGWLAWWRHGRLGAPSSERVRMALGLALGVVSAHALALLQRPPDSLAAVLRPAGFSLLGVPLGVRLALLGAGPAAADAACRALPPALALARCGCLVVGCCAGAVTGWSWPARHPVQLLEVAALLALGGWLERSRLPPRAALSLGFGAIRLLCEPLRAPDALGSPTLPGACWAIAWCVAGALEARLSARAGAACAHGRRRGTRRVG